MTRRIVAMVLALAVALVAAVPVAAGGSSFPQKILLPPGWMPEGITAGRGNTIYVGSLAGGGVWKGNVRTGLGEILVPAWGGAAVGVEYDARSNRLWVAGGPTGTVRVYNASTGSLLRQYTFEDAGFLNDLVVTRHAVYVTDSNNAWLDVIPLGRHGALPPQDGTMTLPLSGELVVEEGEFNANGIVATRGWLILVDTFTGGLFRVNPWTGATRAIPTGGVSVANGDGLELRGSKLYVVRNFDQRVEVFRLGAHLRWAKPLATLTDDDLSVPTTAAVQAGRLWVVSAQFGIPTTEYWVSQL